MFCDSSESIDHLFISCQLACFVWRVIHFIFNISPPTNVTDLFGNWLNGVDKKTKSHITIGVCALLWAIWNCHNDVVFNKSSNANFLQVMHRAAYWIHMWFFLLLVDQLVAMDTGCTRSQSVWNGGMAEFREAVDDCSLQDLSGYVFGLLDSLSCFRIPSCIQS